MQVVPIIYRDETLDLEKFEQFLAEVSKFQIIGKPVFFKEDYLMYRAIIRYKTLEEKAKIDTLINKYMVIPC